MGRQVEALTKKHPDYYPMYTRQGRWKHEGELWTNWCEGFLPGQMWVLHKVTGEARKTLQAVLDDLEGARGLDVRIRRNEAKKLLKSLK